MLSLGHRPRNAMQYVGTVTSPMDVLYVDDTAMVMKGRQTGSSIVACPAPRCCGGREGVVLRRWKAFAINNNSFLCRCPRKKGVEANADCLNRPRPKKR